MAKITWITPEGDLGTYPENTEVSIQLEVDNPLIPDATAGFDPRDSITGNGILGDVVAKIASDKTNWTITSSNIPGVVVTGAFPNDQNPNRISASNQVLDYPYRGGRNKPADAFVKTPLGPVGVSSVGIFFFSSATSIIVPGAAGSAWTVNSVVADIVGEDAFGGNADRFGRYHYTNSKFINNNAWSKIGEYSKGYTHPNGHSKIVGWAADGYPIYGPYGYQNAMSAGNIVKMRSGYTLVEDTKRPRPVSIKIPAGRYDRNIVPVASTDNIYPGMVVRGPWPEGTVKIVNVLQNSLQLNINLPVEIKTDTRLLGVWPLGIFIEDYVYTAPAGTNLDPCNGRYCVTPEFPSGTYAYFMTEDIDNKPQFPYIIGSNFYGDTVADNVGGVANIEPVTITTEYSLLSGALPKGLQLTPTGLLYGFPQVVEVGVQSARSYRFTVRSKNSINQVADRTFTIVVNKIIPPVFVSLGIRGEGVSATFGNIDLSFTNRGRGYFSSNVQVNISGPDLTDGSNAIPGKVYLYGNGAIQSVGLTSPGTGYLTIPTITITGANTVAASATISGLTNQGRENLGYFFDGDYVDLQISLLQVSPTGYLNWKVVQGSLPPGLTISQTGRITGFATSPPAPGPIGTASYDVGKYDQFVYDFEGAADSRVYLFTLRVFDGINYVDQKYKLGIYDKTFFLIDNILITADNTLYTADRDGYQYPSIITESTTLPPVRQYQSYAYQFKSYYSNPNFKVKWSINAGGAARFDQGAFPVPDDNNRYYTLIPYDSKSFDQSDLSLPGGIYIDTETGWLLGTIGATTQTESTFEFTVTAYVEIPISQTVTSIRRSRPVTFTMKVLSDITDLVTWNTNSDLGVLDNGQISTIAIEATTRQGTALSYRVKSGQYLRIPQGLSLLSTGLISGRTSFDYFSLDRKNSEVTFDKTTNTYDSKYTFTVIAEDASGTIYSEKEFTITVRNVNKKPFENLYLKALLPADLRSVFRSIVTDTRLSESGIIYRPDDPYFGVHQDLTMLVMAGVRAETASAYIDAMSNYHYDKQVNFGTIKKAVARNNDSTIKYEVLYVEVFDYNTSNLPGTTITKNSLAPIDYGSVVGDTESTDNYQSILDTETRQDDFGSIDEYAIINKNQVYSNSFANMRKEIEDGIGYEFQGALPEWMQSVQPETGEPLGFVRGLVLAYAKPGQGDKLLYRYRAALEQSGYGVIDIMNKFNFVADRYQWDRGLSINYDPTSGTFVPSKSTTFDRIPSAGIVEKGAWLTRDSNVSTDLLSIVYGKGQYLAVGAASRILSSTSGVNWSVDAQRINFNFTSSLLRSLTAGSTILQLPYTPSLTVDDEVLQTDFFSSNTRSYVTQVYTNIKLSSNIANSIPSGTVLEFINFRDGTRQNITTANITVAGSDQLYVNSVGTIESGFGVYVKGIDVANAAVVNSNVGNTVFLSKVTTNAIDAGTRITFDDLSGNVEILITANATSASSSHITFTTLGNVTTGYYPRMTAIPAGTTLASVFTIANISEPAISTLPAGLELEFTHRLVADAYTNDTVLYYNNTDKFSVGAEIYPVSLQADTGAAASWGSVNPAGTQLYITVPLDSINGEIVRGMQVVGPGLPLSSLVKEISSNVSYANLTVTFNSSVISSRSDVAISLVTPTVVNTGTTIIGKTNNTISLSSPLTANIAVGADATIQYGLTNVQLTSIIYTGERYIAVGDRGLIIDKLDGQKVWSQRLGLVYGDLKAIGYRSYYSGTTLQYTYIAVGNEGTIIRSTDVDNWSLPIPTLANRTLLAVYHNDGQWVAVGEGGQIVTSLDDGSTWTLDNATTSLNLYDVVYYNKWIIAGDNGYIYVRSQSDSSWTQVNIGASDSLRSIAYINNIYYIVGARGLIATSLDALSWKLADRFTNNRLNGISKSAPTPVAVGASGEVLSESPSFAVDWAVRNIPFDQFNYSTVSALTKQGYAVQQGDTLIFVQQEGYGGLNDGWNYFNQVYDDTTGEVVGYDTLNYNDSNIVPGYFDALNTAGVSNQRAGIWQVDISTTNLVTLRFVRQVLPAQIVTVINETSKLFYNPQISTGKTVPEYSLLSTNIPDSTQNTSFDAEGTRFSDNRDNYTEPGTLDKYLKFPKTGVYK
jgi:photosystem II stability/assembly factor-like uncharacterized protein